MAREFETINNTTLLKDSKRSIHIGDRESDIYELFCMAKGLGTHFLVRICADRLIENGQSSIEKKMRSSESKGWHRLELYDTHGNRNEINIEIRYEKMNVLPPLAKQKKYPVLPLTIIYAEEKEPPSNRDPIIWKLATNLPIHATKDAIEKLN